MLNLTESYSPFSTTTFEALTLRGTLKTNTHFEYQEILAPHIKGYPESHMLTQKDPRQINHPGPFLQNAPKQIPSPIFP